MVAFDHLDGRMQLLIVTALGLAVTAIAAVLSMGVCWLIQRCLWRPVRKAVAERRQPLKGRRV
jgi:hypothetical protein